MHQMSYGFIGDGEVGNNSNMNPGREQYIKNEPHFR